MGYDLVNDLIGKINLGDMSFLEVTGRLPNAEESKMFNAMLVTSVEHGIVPSTLATRLTWAGAPEVASRRRRSRAARARDGVQRDHRRRG